MALMGKNTALGVRRNYMARVSRGPGEGSLPSESLHALSRVLLRFGVKCLAQHVLSKEKLLSHVQTPVLLLFECTINISLSFWGVFKSICPHQATLAKSLKKESFLH